MTYLLVLFKKTRIRIMCQSWLSLAFLAASPNGRETSFQFFILGNSTFLFKITFIASISISSYFFVRVEFKPENWTAPSTIFLASTTFSWGRTRNFIPKIKSIWAVISFKKFFFANNSVPIKDKSYSWRILWIYSNCSPNRWAEIEIVVIEPIWTFNSRLM